MYTVTIILEAAGNAPDRYRVFTVAKIGSSSKDNFYWLSGNNKGVGAFCQMDVPYSIDSLIKGTTVFEWGQIPETQCF